ncbi:MAG: replication restart helicase PriA, partial [Gaiellaceae bacterium]
MARFASVYPLVSTRELARPFTYLGDGLEKGSIVRVPFGRTRRRGIVAELVEAPPEGVTPVSVEDVVGAIPPVLVDLALWIADYYGSTPARALALVAPDERKPRRRKAVTGDAQDPEAGTTSRELPTLTAGQESAVSAIVSAFDRGGAFLLAGPTGSGKTEVYLRACAAALERGRGAIVLVPEIALTPQTERRFRERFGQRVAVLHSGLTAAQRRDTRARISSGEATLVVGARSAIFAPVVELGLICVDEEHDGSYKHESDPRYDARSVAMKRLALEGAVAVFGSATPRPEAHERLDVLRLDARIGASLPPVRIVDLRRESGYPLSAPLLEGLERCARGDGKAIVLLNRRGYASALHCRGCGRVWRCSSCDVALVLHQDRALHCHHCGYAEPAPQTCPDCASTEIARLGAGTERLEAELEAQFPALERFRLDAETTAARDSHAEILGNFAAAERGILFGTQMVAKGHHFEDVSLAAVIDAGTESAVPDFRADERTFQLLTQLAGRSGRDRPGRVLIQTFDPDARPVRLAAHHAVEEFMASELERRRELSYPPYCHLVRVLLSGPDSVTPLAALSEIRAALETASGATILGPAPLPRLRRRNRAQLVAKTDEPRALARAARRVLAAAAPALRRDELTAAVDVDP